MRRAIVSRCSLSVLLCSSLFAATASPPGAAFRTIIASDRTFSVEIPVQWQVGSAQAQRFVARSAQGQSVAWGVTNAIDYQHFRQMQHYLGSYAGSVFPVVAQPMAPAQVIENLLPRLNRAVQGVHIIGARSVTAARTGSVLVYRYSLVPAFATPQLRATWPQSLLAPSKTSMQVEALILTNPPNADGIWTIVYWSAESPESSFESTRPAFEHIFASLHYNISAILNMIAEQQRQRSATVAGAIRSQASENAKTQAAIAQFGNTMRQMQEQVFNTFQRSSLKTAEGWIDVYGGRQRFVDTQGSEYDVNLQWHSYQYNCVSGWGAAARYYGSSTMNCSELAGKYGLYDLKPVHPRN